MTNTQQVTPDQAKASTGESRTGTKSAAPLEFRSVTKHYPGGKAPALENLSFTVPAGEVCVLVGPSGCGKTTAMRLVNRMIDLTGGDILIDGKSVMREQPTQLRREIGYVIQQIGLFPHLTINNNIGVVPKLLGWSKKRIHERSAELLDLIGLPEEMGRRYPSQLSGGQRQRVGVARALAADPPLMLMDEPFGAIDPINRDNLQNQFLRLQREIRKTIVFVTHDIDEAIKMGDKIAILKEGGDLVQYDSPSNILANPANEFVAQFVGADRGLKRLALTLLTNSNLADVEKAKTATVGNEPTISRKASLRDALSLMMTEAMRPLLVLDDNGQPVGYVTMEIINEALQTARTEDSAAAGSIG
jgi:osmoprotectant transport system ATP-binding protein